MLKPTHRDERLYVVLRHPMRFMWRVLVSFYNNQGFMLASAVAFNTLLSMVPMLGVILIFLSQFIDQASLLDTARRLVELLAPNEADAVAQQLSAFLEKGHMAGLLGMGVLLTFSSFAFTSLENAMSVIFFHRAAVRRRMFLVSAVIPYLYIVMLTVALMLVSFMASAMETLPARIFAALHVGWSPGTGTAFLLYMLGVASEMILLSSFYLVMPVGRIALGHALVGGVSATLLWEITRHILAWYFASLSYVNVVYGSFATVIVILLSLETGAVILLLGAQVIAEYERLTPQPWMERIKGDDLSGDRKSESRR